MTMSHVTDWSRAFEDPIPLPKGKTLVTLRDAALYITKLPKAGAGQRGVRIAAPDAGTPSPLRRYPGRTCWRKRWRMSLSNPAPKGIAPSRTTSSKIRPIMSCTHPKPKPRPSLGRAQGYTPLVARVRDLSDKKKRDHWRAP
jgi:hypothetical protein